MPPRKSRGKSTQTESSAGETTREREKQELIHLNGRLAAYIDKVQSLELENENLHDRVKQIENKIESERSNLKELYEKELEDTRRLLDGTAGEKARLQIEAGEYRDELGNLKPRVKKLEENLAAANNNVRSLDSSLAEKDGRNGALANDKRSLEGQLNELRNELDKKDKQVKELEEDLAAANNNVSSLDSSLAEKDGRNRALANDKRSLEGQLNKLRKELDKKEKQVKKLEEDLAAANNRVSSLNSSLAEKDGGNRALANDKRSLEVLLNELREELDRKEKQVQVAKKKVEEETVARGDLETRLKSLKEEIAFQKKLHEEEIKEMRKAFDLTDIDMGGDDNTSLLEELRVEQNQQASALRESIDAHRIQIEKFNTDRENLKAIAERYHKQLNDCQEELGHMKSKQDDKDSEIAALKAQIDALVARTKDLEKQIRNEQGLNREALLSPIYKEHKDPELPLDGEIRNYRKLLEGEETRLQGTPSPKRKTPKKPKQVTQENTPRRPTEPRQLEDTQNTVRSSTPIGHVAIEGSDTNDALVARIKDLETQIREASKNRNNEVQKLREAMAEQLEKYQEIMNIKLSQDAEIRNYRHRTDVTPSPQERTPAKRRRLRDTSTTATRRISIDEGEFTKLLNTSDIDQPLGGWVLKRSIDGSKEATYKFSSKYVLKSGEDVTIWSNDSNPSSDIGERIETTLYDASGEVVATRDVAREVTSSQEHEVSESGDPTPRCPLM